MNPKSLRESASGRAVVDAGLYITGHATERFRKHHPHADWRMGLRCVASAVEVSQGAIAPLIGRSVKAVPDRYFLTADRQGVWVVAPGRPGASRPWSAVTYLRFQAYQKQLAERLWKEEGR